MGSMSAGTRSGIAEPETTSVRSDDKAAARALRLAVLVDRYPVASESFVRNEIEALREAGAQLEVFACDPHAPRATSAPRISTSPASGAAHAAEARRLLDLVRSARVIVEALWFAATVYGFRRTGLLGAFRAVAAAHRLSPSIRHGQFSLLHAHFINRPAMVAVLVSRMTRVPCTVSAHARDVFVPELNLARIVRAARLVLACSPDAHRELQAAIPPALRHRVRLLRHGVDLRRFRVRAREPEAERHAAPAPEPCTRSVRVLTVARLVPKKGVDTVLAGLHDLACRGWHVTFCLIGDGPLRESLLGRPLPWNLNLEHVAEAAPATVYERMCGADVLVMGCTRANDGDRDGIPNAVLEAMAAGLPVVAATGGSVADVIEHGVTGLLVPENDPVALADAVTRIMADAAARAEMTRAARRRIESRHDLRANARELYHWLRTASEEACRA
jgi:glycosyltransferase involved in cell wall biosynthesis